MSEGLSPGSDFLKQKYDLHNTPEVASAARRTEIKTGEKVPHNPEAEITNYLDRFKEIIDRKDPQRRQHGIDALKRWMFDRFVTKYEDIPQSYWDFQERVMRERGQGGDWANADPEEKEQIKHQTAEALISDQRSSLEQWIDYFASSDSDYMPPELKYWTIRSVLGLVEYDKDKKEFPKRSKGAVKEFPDINHEALAYVIDSIIKKYKGQYPEYNYDIGPEEQTKFQRFLNNENFAKLYGWSIEQINPIPEHLLRVTEGKWIKYDQNSDHMPLVRSIQGKGTGWCTAGENTAKTQLQGGDFYVYYSNDDNGNPTIPRIAIRMEQDKIAEVRGIAYKQNLDPFIAPVLEEKLNEFPDKDEYLKKEHDMSHLTEIDNKTKNNIPLTKEELIFLYEIDSKIQGFGYQDDPRIKELRDKRNPKEDAPIVFDCEPNKIIWNENGEQSFFPENVKAYIGPLFPNIFKTLEHIDNIYTSFPEGKIRRSELEIGGKTEQELEEELERNGHKISNYAKSMMRNPDFTTLPNPETLNLIRLRVGDLGFPDGATTQEIYDRAEEYGLELCPPETGPYKRLQDKNQPMNNWYSIAMKQITDSGGCPGVFYMGRNSSGSWVGSNWTYSGNRWDPDDELMFCLRPSTKA